MSIPTFFNEIIKEVTDSVKVRIVLIIKGWRRYFKTVQGGFLYWTTFGSPSSETGYGVCCFYSKMNG